MHQKLILFSGFVFSLLLHSALFNWLSVDAQPISAQSATPSTTVVTLCAPTYKEKKKKVTPKPKTPKKKPIPDPNPVPKPETKKAPLLEPEKSKESIEEETVEEEQTEQAPPASEQTAESQISSDELEAKKNIFLQELKETIRRNKSYPKVARRRGIQGEVSLTFCVLADGSLTNIDIISGKKVFYAAVREAIKKSSPLLNPPEVLSYPLEVTLKLGFRLK